LRTGLTFVAAIHGIRGEQNLDLVDWHLQRYGLVDYEDIDWSVLSDGLKVRYELARVLIAQPRLLILDEPLASLDIVARQQFLKNLVAVAHSLENSVPTIITSQHLYELEGIVDQMIILENGKSVFCGTMKELEERAEARLFELTYYGSAPQVIPIAGARIVEITSDGLVVAFPKDIERTELMRALVERCGNQLIALRDITGSTRRYFF
jgi:ABC-2 type transport system ATP-binding protein